MARNLMIGGVLAVVYVRVAASHLPGPPAVRGALFSIAPWLVAQVVMMPMMGMGFFSGSIAAAMGSLVGHLVYGVVIGAIIGEPQPLA